MKNIRIVTEQEIIDSETEVHRCIKCKKVITPEMDRKTYAAVGRFYRCPCTLGKSQQMSDYERKSSLY